MINTIEDAQKHGLKIRREIRFFAYDEKSGINHALHHDWKLEEINHKLDILEQTNDK